MSGDYYLRELLGRYELADGADGPAGRIAEAVGPLVRGYYGRSVLDISLSGSYAKGTRIAASDVDLFISLAPPSGALADLYDGLCAHLADHRLAVQRTSVALRFTYYLNAEAHRVDVIPARRLPDPSGDHCLYCTRSGSWMKTNVRRHIRLVRDSGRQAEIRLVKIWRGLEQVEFPSFYLELSVLRALEGRPAGTLSANLRAVFAYMRDHFPAARIVDPANAGNVISDGLTEPQKALVAHRAGEALTRKAWPEVLG